ncbi:hypothetical protein BACCIP111883_01066 [Sutcliffiella rhizosphaerae]|uniref:Uncharacterized protein n=1 Tax=Sutcliffiella rhizosphaerae TaxID=2880967 RepID=A0ABM8YK68_9BACI|nr:hypothetical protein BACCIP111883_01066 [Sutcliffiella rhizosphaerae]
MEDSKFDKLKGRTLPMDLSWWKWDQRKKTDEYDYLVLHLKRESSWRKVDQTIEKLFSMTEEGYVPNDVIGIQFIESEKRVAHHNEFDNLCLLRIYRDSSFSTPTSPPFPRYFPTQKPWNLPSFGRIPGILFSDNIGSLNPFLKMNSLFKRFFT